MVHFFGSLECLSSILGKYWSNCSQHQGMDSPQIIPVSCPERLRNSIVVVENNNYLTRVIGPCDDSESQWSQWSSNSNWTRKVPLIPVKSKPSSSHRSYIFCLGGILVTLILVVIGVLFITKYIDFRDGKSTTTKFISTANTTQVNDLEEDDAVDLNLSPISPKTKASISRQAWLALQKNAARESKPSQNPILFSISKDKVHRIPCGQPLDKTSCCQLNKSMEILAVPGCSPIEVPKNRCIGACDYVFVEGNPYVSIPKCQGVRIRKQKFKLSCGQEVRRVTVEVIARCGCA